MNSTQLAIVMRMLADTATVAAVVLGTGMTRQTIYRTLRALERERIARIVRWNCDHTGRAAEPVWGLGSDPSDIKARMTDAEKQQRHRRKKKRVTQSIVATLSTSPAAPALAE
jgi:hypothetical protein